MTSAFSWQNSTSLCPASLRIPRPNLPVTPMFTGKSDAKAEKGEFIWLYEDLEDLLELIPQEDVLFVIGDWNAKVESQETLVTPGICQGNFGLGVQNEAG